MVDALETGAFAILEGETDLPVGEVELLGAPASRPLGLEVREQALNLSEIRPVAPRIGAAVGGVLDARAGDDVLDNFRQIADAVVLLSAADVERLVVNDLARRRQRRHEGP